MAGSGWRPWKGATEPGMPAAPGSLQCSGQAEERGSWWRSPDIFTDLDPWHIEKQSSGVSGVVTSRGRAQGKFLSYYFKGMLSTKFLQSTHITPTREKKSALLNKSKPDLFCGMLGMISRSKK